jgi:hypothetical protein
MNMCEPTSAHDKRLHDGGVVILCALCVVNSFNFLKILTYYFTELSSVNILLTLIFATFQI